MRRTHRLTGDPERLKRAATEEMTVRDVEGKGWLKIVETKHGTYTVNSKAQSCTCRDFSQRILKLRQAGDRDANCKLTVAHFATAMLLVLYGARMLQVSLLVIPLSLRKGER